MPLHSYFVLIAFTLLFLVFTFQLIWFGNTGSQLLGSPSIEKLYFYTGKFALFITWLLFIVKAVNPRLGYIYIPVSLSWVAVGLLYSGVIIVGISLMNLGKSLAAGLPKQETTLRTHGLYRFSRNPMYAGFHLIAIASCLYFPDLINVSFTVYGIYIHHQIIRSEERFLADRFGTEWLIYSARVGRYI